MQLDGDAEQSCQLIECLRKLLFNYSEINASHPA